MSRTKATGGHRIGIEAEDDYLLRIAAQLPGGQERTERSVPFDIVPLPR